MSGSDIRNGGNAEGEPISEKLSQAEELLYGLLYPLYDQVYLFISIFLVHSFFITPLRS